MKTLARMLVAACALMLTLVAIAPEEASAGWRRSYGYYGPGAGVYVGPGYGYYGGGYAPYGYGYNSYPAYGYGYKAYPAYGYGYNSYPAYGYNHGDQQQNYGILIHSNPFLNISLSNTNARQ